METEEEFKNTVAILEHLEKQKAASNEVIEKAQVEAIKCIESQFERCLLVLANRKQQLLAQVDALASEQKKHKEMHEKQLGAAVEGCKKLLEASTALYAQHRGAAIAILKGANELKYDTAIPTTGIAVNFDTEVMLKIETYVYTPEKQIAIAIQPSPSADKKERVVTLAGSSTGLENGVGEAAKFSGPRGMCLDSLENCLYVCDGYNNVVRRVTLEGAVTSFAAVKGDLQLCNPFGITIHHREGCLFVTSMLHHCIKKITVRGVITTLAGTGKPGNKDSKEGMKAQFHCPAGITVDQKTGNIYVCDQNNHCIRRISPQVATLAGSGQPGFRDGDSSAAQFNFPTGILFLENLQCLIVCDTANNKLRKITLSGAATTLCQVAEPTDVTVAKSGKFYVSTYSNVIVTLAQNENGVWAKEGDSITSNFEGPHGIVIDDSSNTCFVVDCDNNRICKISL